MLSQTAPPRRPGGSRPRPNLALFDARMRAGLSREELGHLAGITGKQVGLIERGIARRSRPSTLAGLATALEKDVLDLFAVRHRI